MSEPWGPWKYSFLKFVIWSRIRGERIFRVCRDQGVPVRFECRKKSCFESLDLGFGSKRDDINYWDGELTGDLRLRSPNIDIGNLLEFLAGCLSFGALPLSWQADFGFSFQSLQFQSVLAREQERICFGMSESVRPCSFGCCFKVNSCTRECWVISYSMSLEWLIWGDCWICYRGRDLRFFQCLGVRPLWRRPPGLETCDVSASKGGLRQGALRARASGLWNMEGWAVGSPSHRLCPGPEVVELSIAEFIWRRKSRTNGRITSSACRSESSHG
jgi:hypothetical protein